MKMGKKKRHRRQRQRRRPLYKCMVKTAMACLKHKPGATRQEIERKVMLIYKKRGLDNSKHPKSIGRAIRSLMKARCVRKRGSQYKIEPECARDALSVHKRRRRRRRTQSRIQSRSRSQSNRSRSGSQSGSRSGSRSGSHRHCSKKKLRRARRHRKKQCQRKNGRNTPTICHLNVRPQICPSNPVCRFPLRDAMIIAMTIFFSYWMQRAASHMQFNRLEVPDVPIHLN